MAYHGSYQEQHRPHNGSTAHRPGARGGMPSRGGGLGGGRGAYPQPPPPQHDQYQDEYAGYGRDQYDDGYGPGPDYGAPQQDVNFAPNGYPPRDPYGHGPAGPSRGGRGHMPSAPGPPRGAPMPPRAAPGGRGGYPGPGRGSRPGPPDRSATADPITSRRGPHMMGGPNDPDYGTSNPTPPRRTRETDVDIENQMAGRMAHMNINGGPVGAGSARRPTMPPGQSSASPHRGPGPGPRRGPPMDEYGGGGMRPTEGPRSAGRGHQQGYPGPRRAPTTDQSYGGFHDDGYGDHTQQGHDVYGAPSRSMTMPNNVEPMSNGGIPSRTGSAPYSGAVARNVPARPSTAAARPPPARMYQNHGPPPQERYDAGYDQPPPQAEERWGPPPPIEPPGQRGVPHPAGRASFGDFYDAYYDPGANADYQPQHSTLVGESESNHRDPAPYYPPRRSIDHHMRPGPGPGQPQPGPARFAELSRTKSQPDLREPQTAVFEMAHGEPMPPLPYGAMPPYDDRLSGPSLGPQHAPPNGGPPNTAHPMPIRPGLMANSMVNLNERPAPQRQYSASSAGTGGAPGRPPPQQQQQQQHQQQPPPPPLHIPPLSSAPAANIPVTADELEVLRAMVKANSNDQKSAMTLAKKLIEAADVLVARIADAKARARARERYVSDAHKILKKLVAAQNPDAMFTLADAMGRGVLSGDPDNKEAFTLYQSAAKLNHAPAAYRTAVCCEIGNEDGGGTRRDPQKAIQWYKRAAALGDTPAMYKVGMIMLKGLLGQARNPREAVTWLKRAAEAADAENPHALHELGLLYESAQPNDAMVRDEGYAFQLFKQAAELGYKFSQFRLGCAYEYGLMACPIDPRSSIMWYSRAASQEEHQAELALSGWYLTGSEGVLQQSDTEAYLWARKAASAGLAKAEYAMGYFTEVGIGVQPNLEDAKRWYWRAAAQDFPKARERLEDLKRSGRNAPRPRERISRSKIGKQQEGECSLM